MRVVRGLAFVALSTVATSAAAQTVRPADPESESARALLGAAFARPAQGSLSSFAPGSGSTLSVRRDAVQASAAGGVFATPVASGTRLDQTSLLGADRYRQGEGLVRWRTGESLRSAGGNAVDAVRFSVGGVDRGPLGGEATDEAFDVTYTRGWVSALRGRAENGLAFDLTPRAGVGLSSGGGQAIAGAMLRVGDIDLEDRVNERLSAIVGDGRRFGDRGRWYLFAAADGKAVGLNILRGEDGWERSGLTEDATAVVGEAQVGVGWRKGAMQASFGVLHREIKTKPAEGLDEHQIEDQAVAFTLSIKPGKR